MNYWLICLPRKDMEHCIRIETFGLNRKILIDRVREGDKVACYITKEKKIAAVGEVTESYYMDISKVFRADGVFPDRFHFRATVLKKELDFEVLIEKLNFITNKMHWSAYLRNGIANLTEADWNLIADSGKGTLVP